MGVNIDVIELFFIVIVDGGGGNDSYMFVMVLFVGQVDKFEIDILIWVIGFMIVQNNGLKVLVVDVMVSIMFEVVIGMFVVEIVIVCILFVGYCVVGMDMVMWDWDVVNSEVMFNSMGIGMELQVFGLIVGQFIYVGLFDGFGGVQNVFENVVVNDMFGYVCVVSFMVNMVLFDKVFVVL